MLHKYRLLLLKIRFECINIKIEFNMYLKNTAYVLLVWLLVNVSHAASLVISPFRANLNATQTSAVFNVANQRETPMVVQVNAVEWLQQASGEDVFNDTDDIIATPAIVTIPPKTNYVIRVGLLKDIMSTQEKTYRLFIEEIPSPDTQKTGLNIALRASLPIFVAPKFITPAPPSIVWTLKRMTKDSVVLSAHNTGNSHVQILGYHFLLNGVEVFKNTKVLSYLLPNTQKEWTIKTDKLLPQQTIQLHIKTDITEQVLVTDITVEG